MASVSTPRKMVFLCLGTVLVFVALIGQTNGDIDVASSFTGAADLLKDAAAPAAGAAETFRERAANFFSGGGGKDDNDVNSPGRSGGDAASNDNVNSASNAEGFEEEEGTLGGDWRVIGH